MNQGAVRLATASVAAIAIAFVAGSAQAQSGGSSTQPATSAIPGGNEPTPETTPGAPPVQAQASPDEERVTLGDIVVTARKRAAGEALQATPIAATAVSGAEMQQAQAVNLVDVGRLSPGVSFQGSSGRAVANFSIRGVGINGSTPSDEPAVGIFQDGIYWGSNNGALGEMFDMESVEVLRGPQGTLFGRNVTGGAVALHTARPNFTPSASVSAGYGWRNTIDGSVILNGPVVGDTVAVRIAASGRTTDGYWNWALRPGEPYGRETVLLIRPSILIRPSDGFELIIRGEYFSQLGDPVAIRGEAPGTHKGATLLTSPVREGFRTDPNFFNISVGGRSRDDRGRNDVDVYLASAEMNADIGPGVLTWVNGFRQVNTFSRSDFDGFPTAAFTADGGYFAQHQFSSELRYAADLGDVVGFTTGLFYFHQAFQSYDTRVLDNGASVLAQKAELRSNDGYAVFAEADFKITPQLTLTLGGRYTIDKKEAQIAPYGACTPYTFTVCTFGPIRKAEDKKFTPKVGVSWQATPDNLLYASYTQGIRSGGYALRGGALTVNPFLAEQITAYEIGTKNDFFGNRLRLNVSAYHYDYTDIQRTQQVFDAQLGIISTTGNASSARIRGVDVGINAQVTNELRLDIAYGHVDAKYKAFAGFPDVSKLKFARVPDDTITGGLTYDVDLGDGSGINFRASAAYTGPYFYADAQLTNDIGQRGYTLVDSQIQYRLPGGKSTVSLWGRNLTNEHYAGWGSDGGTRFTNRFIGAPRTYGIRLSHDF